MIKPGFLPNHCSAATTDIMEDERIARALNLLGENADLFSSDSDALLELVEDHFEDHAG